MKAIAYTRRSTDTNESQIHSLQAQKKEILDYAAKNGIEIVACFSESISGKIKDRPEFMKAVDMAKSKKLPIIAKSLSRIGRNAAQVLEIMDTVEVIITEYGKTVDRDFLNLMAVINNMEVKAISRRTKSALALLKANGVKLGNPNIEVARAAAITKRKALALSFALKIAPLIMNGNNHSQMARILNNSDVKTRLGRKWSPQTVRKIRTLILNHKEG
jgi:DNA invertase Pin-like site-specific DNA recombinase